MLVLYDDNLDALWAFPVEQKGSVQFVVSWCVGVLEISGYSNLDITLKSDQGPAMSSLKSAIEANRAGQTAIIDSPLRESRANGGLGNAVRRWQGQSRTLRYHFEARIGRTLPQDNVPFGWLVVFAAEVLLKCRIRSDGGTSYGRMTKHRCSRQAVGCGE